MPVERSTNRTAWLAAGGIVLLLGGIVAGFFLWFNHPTSTQGAIPELPRTALTLRDGRLYQGSNAIPFSGRMIESYEDGSLKSRSVIAQGLLHGLSEGWHTNGVMQVREHFTNGVSHGVREKWFASGNRLSECMIVGGKIHGIFLRWHDNEHLAERIEMKQGQPEGVAQAFYPSGFLKSEATLAEGKLIQSKSWEDGEKKPVISENDGLEK